MYMLWRRDLSKHLTSGMDDIVGFVYYSNARMVNVLINEYNMVNTNHSKDKFGGNGTSYFMCSLKTTEQIMESIY